MSDCMSADWLLIKLATCPVNQTWCGPTAVSALSIVALLLLAPLSMIRLNVAVNFTTLQTDLVLAIVNIYAGSF
jgi:hypothetical protein